MRSPDRGFFARLVANWKESRSAWHGLAAFNAAPRVDKRIVFYAETAADWAFLGPVCSNLEARGAKVLKICSDAADAVAGSPGGFYVGFGAARTALFRSIEADVFVMTLSDLETFHLKRSVHPVHYAYVFHSIASTHRVYREHAFDAYDTILCVGQHHIDEIRQTESAYGLRAKKLVPHGYGRLDTLMRDFAARPAVCVAEGAAPRVLVAPSWGECSIVKHCLDPLIDVLLKAGFRVAVRFHPMTRRHDPGLPDRLLARYGATGRFEFDPHINTTDSLLAADIMISEWSGAPLEFAFARERPVVFIDTPPKIHNPNFARTGAPLLEVDIREKIGRVVGLDSLERLPGIVRELVESSGLWAEPIRKVREQTVFNVGRSGEAGAEVVLDIAAGRVR